MIKNTPENKARFFALYWGQRLVSWKENTGKLKLVNSGYINESSTFLELTPLSQITDEDAEYCIGSAEYYLRRNDEKSVNFGMSPSGMFINTLIGHNSYFIGKQEADYLRLKGYAVRWLDLSVKQLVEYGWIKLKEKSK